MCLCAIDVTLGKEVKLHAEAIGKRSDLLRRAGLLLAKLIAREAKDAQAARVQLVVQRHQFLVVARR